MNVDILEILVPKKVRLGNAAWEIIHRAPYGSEDSEDIHQFARDFLSLLVGVVGAFPCAGCRKHAAKNVRLQAVISEVRSYVDTLKVDCPQDVADELAVLAFIAHQAVHDTVVRNDLSPEDAGLLNIQSETLVGLRDALESGDVTREYVAAILRIRWDSEAT